MEKGKVRNLILVVAMVFLNGCLFQRGPYSDDMTTDADSVSDQTEELSDAPKNIKTGTVATEDTNDELSGSDEWRSEKLLNGQMPECYNLKPSVSDIDNYLDIVVGGGTDVCIKLMNLRTEKCDRFVFVNSGTTYKITNIPEGKYFLKIAYGRNWQSKTENGICSGRFLENAFFEKGVDILDYYLKYNDKGYKIPSFSLELDVIQSDISNSFRSENISESEFNL